MFHRYKLRLSLFGLLSAIAIATCTLTWLGLPQPLPEPQSLTAQQITDRIIAALDTPWEKDGADGYKDGDPSTPITGVAVAMMSTMEVLQRAVAANANLVITHEPTFYNGQDEFKELEQQQDGVIATKRTYIKEHHLVIWRLHDHWHAPLQSPDPVLQGLLEQLGWQRYLNQPDGNVVTIPATTVGALVLEITTRTQAAAVRVVGEAGQPVTRVALLPGSVGFGRHWQALNSNVDVLVVGETREWETVPYVADAIAQGQRKALIVLGHVPSEEGGSQYLAQWLQPILPDLPVQYIETGDPFWLPK